MKSLWKSISCSMNVQYKSYKDTEQVLKAVRQQHTNKLQPQLTSQGFTMKSLNSLRSSGERKLPKNISSLSIRYLNNVLTNNMNIHKWKLSQSSDYSFCLRPKSLLLVVSGCKSHLEKAATHKGIIQYQVFVPSTLKCVRNSSLYVDFPGFCSPCIITGDQLCPDKLLYVGKTILYIIELTVGFETNINSSAERKQKQQHQLP